MPYKTITQDPTLPQGFNKTFRERFWKGVDKNGPVPESCPELGPCWLWTEMLDKNGYGQMNKGNNRCVFSHRASWIIHNGAIPEGFGALHKCDNPQCVNPTHLFLGTQQDNMADCRAKGRHARGEGHYAAKLTWKSVRAMRALFEGGISQTTIAKRYAINLRLVGKVVHYQRWVE